MATATATPSPIHVGRHRPDRQEGQGQGRLDERGRGPLRAAPPGRRPDARAQAEHAVSQAGQGHARRYRHLLAPARHDDDRRHPARAVVRHRRRGPREPGHAEADPRDQGRRRRRHVAARGAREASAALRRPVREPRGGRRAGRCARNAARQDRHLQGKDRGHQEEDQEGVVLSRGRRRRGHHRHGDSDDLRHSGVRVAVPRLRRRPAGLHALRHRHLEVRAEQGLAAAHRCSSAASGA